MGELGPEWPGLLLVEVDVLMSELSRYPEPDTDQYFTAKDIR